MTQTLAPTGPSRRHGRGSHAPTHPRRSTAQAASIKGVAAGRGQGGRGQAWRPEPGRQTFQVYVEKAWLPNHEVEATTRQSYTYSIYKHLMPMFGPMRMIDILLEHVRARVTALKDAGVTPVTIKYNKVLLSATFTTALNDQVVFVPPVQGREVADRCAEATDDHHPGQFGRVLGALPDDRMRLLAETKIETGLRWG
jgi:hypothetical protein